MKSLVIVVIVFCAFKPQPTVATGSTCSTSCEEPCGPIPQCQYGLVFDVPCFCCLVCGKGPGESCSYSTAMCGTGLECKQQDGQYGLVSGTCVTRAADPLNITSYGEIRREDYFVNGGEKNFKHQILATFTVLSIMLISLIQ